MTLGERFFTTFAPGLSYGVPCSDEDVLAYQLFFGWWAELDGSIPKPLVADADPNTDVPKPEPEPGWSVTTIQTYDDLSKFQFDPQAQSTNKTIELLYNYVSNGGDYLENDDGMCCIPTLPATSADMIMTYIELYPNEFTFTPEMKDSAIPFLISGLGSLRRVDGNLKLVKDYQAWRQWARFQIRVSYRRDNSDPLGLPEDKPLWEALLKNAVRSNTKNACRLTFALRQLRRHFGARLIPSPSGLKMRAGKEGANQFLEYMDKLGTRDWLKHELTKEAYK